ncbi:MAG: hypothetical protein ACFB3T_10440 [Geminicoccaceae bacterium]
MALDATLAPDTAPVVALRPPQQVMRLERMGSAFATRLSFMPSLLRQLARENWTFSRPVFAIDSAGCGHAVLAVHKDGRSYSLVAFCQDLDPSDRTDRVIAEQWDATFALFDGVPGDDDLTRLAANVPKQEAGRFLPSELVLSRANKSVRFFEHVVNALASGIQPDPTLVRQVGYLMRTTAVYGNGKFGIADRAKIAERPEFRGPFRVEMLTVYLIRCFTLELVEHLARCRNPAGAVALDGAIKRHLGIGNATGLGMAPFLIHHPVLLHNWIRARETALARVRSLPVIAPVPRERFNALLACAKAHLNEWQVADLRQTGRIDALHGDLEWLRHWWHDDTAWMQGALPWDALYRRAAATLSLEGQELLVALMLEPYGPLIDDLAEQMSADGDGDLDPTMAVGTLRSLIAAHYAWAFDIDFTRRETQQLFWYVSEEKAEPRVGHRFAEPGADKEMPLAVARDVQPLALALKATDAGESTAAFLARMPAFRHLVRRVQTVARHPYGEIHDNLLDAACLPIDLLRCKLAFFGAGKFDPKSDRWTRITMYQGAPTAEELTPQRADTWCLPALAVS